LWNTHAHSILRKVLIVDLSCVAGYGHHGDLIDLVAAHVADASTEVIASIPTLSTAVLRGPLARVLKEGPSPYEVRPGEYGMPVPQAYARLVEAVSLVVPFHKARARVQRAASLPVWLIHQRRIVRDYLVGLFARLGMGRQDTVVLPSADLLTTLALLDIAMEMRAQAPRIALRFINVFENQAGGALKPILWRHLLKALELSTSLRIGVETRAYLSTLPSALLPYASLVVYPPSAFADLHATKQPDDVSKNMVGILGSARPDKGFEDVPRVVELARREGLGLRFLVQKSARPWGASYLKTVDQLERMPEVVLLDGALSRSEILEAVGRCSALLMPYDPSVYALRGSAMVMEAADHGLLSIARAGSAFAHDVVADGVGFAYGSESELIDALKATMSCSQQRAARSRIAAFNTRRLEMFQAWAGHQ